MVEWVALRPILEVVNKETGYEGGRRRQKPWWRQTAASKQLIATLKDILPAARERRWKSGRHGGGRRDREVADSESDAGRNGPWDAGTDTGDA